MSLKVADQRRIRTMYTREGKPIDAIAAALPGVTRKQVRDYVDAEQLKRPTSTDVPLTVEQAQRVRKLYVEDGRARETIARVIGVKLAQVERLIVEENLQRAPNSGGATPAEPMEDRIARLRLVREEQAALMAAAGEKSLRATLERVLRETAQMFAPPPPYKAPKQSGEVVEETMLLMLSDWHLYEIVDPDRVRDLNFYNADTAARRVYQVVQSAISIKRKMERAGWRFPRLVVGLNGDLISGSIHEVERHGDAPSVAHATYGAGLLLAQALRDLAAEFPETEVFCTSGNHGRFGDARRVQQKDPQRSWDTMIAWYAKEHLRELGDRIRFHIPNSYSVMFEVEGWRFLQTHGHDVKSWNAIPWYGINRLVSNLNALESARGVTIHNYLFGHFHTATSLPHAAGESFINGSLIGGTEFSVHGMGKSDRPCQWLLGVHRDHGVTHRWPLSAEGQHDGTYDVRPWLNAK